MTRVPLRERQMGFISRDGKQISSYLSGDVARNELYRRHGRKGEMTNVGGTLMGYRMTCYVDEVIMWDR